MLHDSATSVLRKSHAMAMDRVLTIALMFACRGLKFVFVNACFRIVMTGLILVLALASSPDARQSSPMARTVVMTYSGILTAADRITCQVDDGNAPMMHCVMACSASCMAILNPVAEYAPSSADIRIEDRSPKLDDSAGPPNPDPPQVPILN